MISTIELNKILNSLAKPIVKFRENSPFFPTRRGKIVDNKDLLRVGRAPASNVIIILTTGKGN